MSGESPSPSLPGRSSSDVTRIPIHVSSGTLVAVLQVDLDEEILTRFREDLLQKLHSTGVRGVLIDVSGLDVLDSRDFAALRSTLEMARLMGARGVLVGLNAGIVASLVALDADISGVTATLDLDEAFRLLGRRKRLEGGDDSR